MFPRSHEPWESVRETGSQPSVDVNYIDVG